MSNENGRLSQLNSNVEIENSSLNAKELFYKYFQHGWLFVLVSILALTAAWLYLRYTKPVYSVSSTLLIRDGKNNRSGNGMSSQDMFSDIALFEPSTNKQNEILILTSRTMMERVVRSLHLQTMYSVVGNIKVIDVYPENPFTLEIVSVSDSSRPFSLELHFNENWSKFSIGDSKTFYSSGEYFELPFGTFKIIPRKTVYTKLTFRDFIVSWNNVSQAALLHVGRLDVKPANDQSNVLSLTYVHENPAFATAVLNNLMYQYNNAAIEDKNEMNRKILSFINDRLSLVESQLDSVEGSLQRYRTAKKIINLPSQSTMYFDNIGELNLDLRKNETQMQVIELLEQYLQGSTTTYSLVPSTLGLTDATLVQQTTAYNKLVNERILQLQTGATSDNPIVKNIENNIDEARQKILENLNNLKKVYRHTINTLKRESGNVQKEIETIPERERQSRERARQQEIKQNLYLYLMQKREESEIAQASTIANTRIIDTALPISNIVNPKPFKVYGIAIILGLLVPVGIISLKDILNDKVIVRSDITKVTNAPLLGEVGHSAEEKVLLFPKSSRTIVAEQMRMLRSNLRFVLGDKFDRPTILVTSSFSGEGKSFISTNLGATLAISGKKTVILEFDLRKPKILAGMGLPKSSGLTNYLVGSAKLDELAQPVPSIDNLFVISCGPVPPNPSEILLTGRIEELFKWLKAEFEAIVIDTAPVGLVSDALTLSQYADSTLYVVRQRYTFKRQLTFIEELYRHKKLPRLGLLVNDVVAQGSKGYYGYGGGRYGYGYGYGYKENNGYYEEEREVFSRRIKRIFS